MCWPGLCVRLRKLLKKDVLLLYGFTPPWRVKKGNKPFILGVQWPTLVAIRGMKGWSVTREGRILIGSPVQALKPA